MQKIISCRNLKSIRTKELSRCVASCARETKESEGDKVKKVIHTICIFIFAIIVVGLSQKVDANSISKISMDIYIEKNGDAKVTETWNCNVDRGTEVYHPYYNLGNSKIQNLRVKEKGKYYQTLSSWRTSGSLSEKANKCGINKISDGVELCWGMGEYR